MVLRRILDTMINAALALILAMLVWIVATQDQDPTVVDTYAAPVPLTRIHEPPGTLVYGQSAESVRVTLRAPQSLWAQFSPDEFKAEIDLAGQPYGLISAPVHVRVDNRAIQVVRVEPATVDLHLEQVTEQSVPVRITTTGEPALGYVARAASATPSQVTVRGPASFVGQVTAVVGTVSAQNLRQSLDQSVRLNPVDKDSNPVGFVTLTPESVQATVTIDHLGGFRDLAVKVIVRGQVAPGYRISNISVTPPIVTVFGSSQTIDQSPGFLETAPITVTNAQDDVVERVALNVPGGLSVLGDPSVHVSIQVEAIQGGLTVQRPLTVVGLPQGMDVRVSPEMIDVVLTGALPKLQALKSDDVRVILDLARLGTGTHQVTPQVVVPQGIVAESMLPATIQVTIGPTGTLETSPVATPTRTK